MNSFTPPEYSEFGPVWMVCPIERSEEFGTYTAYLVVDLDYDTENYTGRAIAECSSQEDAETVATALNQK